MKETLLSIIKQPTDCKQGMGLSSNMIIWYERIPLYHQVPTHAVVRIRGTSKALAMTTDCNSRYIYFDPETGGKIAVAEAARNIVCSGAEPLAITDCLNFGNPEKPEVFWQIEKAADGMSEACRSVKYTCHRRKCLFI